MEPAPDNDAPLWHGGSGVEVLRQFKSPLIYLLFVAAAVSFVPALNRSFHTAPIPFSEVLTIGAVGSPVLWVEEGRKAIARRRMRRVPLAHPLEQQ
jgi:hypothetical protein